MPLKQKPTFAKVPNLASLSDLAELEIFDNQSVTASDFFMGLRLTFGPARIPSADGEFSADVMINRCTVQFVTQGCSIAPTGHVGAVLAEGPTRAIEETLGHSEGRTRKRSGSAGADVSGTAIGPSGAFKAQGERSRESREDMSATIKSSYTTSDTYFARWPKDRWKIEDPKGAALTGTITTKDHFYRIDFEQDSGHVSASLRCYPEDLQITFSDTNRLNFKVWNKSAKHRSIIQALVSKTLRELHLDGKIAPDGQMNLAAYKLLYMVPDENDGKN